MEWKNVILLMDGEVLYGEILTDADTPKKIRDCFYEKSVVHSQEELSRLQYQCIIEVSDDIKTIKEDSLPLTI